MQVELKPINQFRGREVLYPHLMQQGEAVLQVLVVLMQHSMQEMQTAK